jgi:hypothetical protein
LAAAGMGGCGLWYRRGSEPRNWRRRAQVFADFGTAGVSNFAIGGGGCGQLWTLAPPGYRTSQLAAAGAGNCGLWHRRGIELRSWRRRARATVDLGTAGVSNFAIGVGGYGRLRTLVPPGYRTSQLAPAGAGNCGLWYRRGLWARGADGLPGRMLRMFRLNRHRRGGDGRTGGRVAASRLRSAHVEGSGHDESQQDASPDQCGDAACYTRGAAARDPLRR